MGDIKLLNGAPIWPHVRIAQVSQNGSCAVINDDQATCQAKQSYIKTMSYAQNIRFQQCVLWAMIEHIPMIYLELILA